MQDPPKKTKDKDDEKDQSEEKTEEVIVIPPVDNDLSRRSSCGPKDEDFEDKKLRWDES